MATKNKVETERSVPELSDAEREQAEKEGVKDAFKQSAQTNFATRSATESNTEGDRWPDRSDVQQWAHLLGLGIDAFKDAIDEKATVTVPESKVAGLLGMERVGQNRDLYIEAMMKRLKVDDVYEVTTDGPDFVNEVKSAKALKRSK